MPSLQTIMNMPKPIISAVNGAAAGIGSAYAMACDLTDYGRRCIYSSSFQ